MTFEEWARLKGIAPDAEHLLIREAWKAGFDAGDAEGYKLCREEGAPNDASYEDGRADGWYDGYDDGMRDGRLESE